MPIIMGTRRKVDRGCHSLFTHSLLLMRKGGQEREEQGLLFINNKFSQSVVLSRLLSIAGDAKCQSAGIKSKL